MCARVSFPFEDQSLARPRFAKPSAKRKEMVPLVVSVPLTTADSNSSSGSRWARTVAPGFFITPSGGQGFFNHPWPARARQTDRQTAEEVVGVLGEGVLR